jgi:hypothetical protein
VLTLMTDRTSANRKMPSTPWVHVTAVTASPSCTPSPLSAYRTDLRNRIAIEHAPHFGRGGLGSDEVD